MISKSKSKITLKDITSDVDKISNLGKWVLEGIPCSYARLQSPAAPGANKEPVSEFYIKGPTGKYLVDSLVYTPHGLVWVHEGVTHIMPLANIRQVRPIL
jgi:hypothetical protein